MKKTRSVKQDYTVCDLCGNETNSWSIGIQSGNAWYCDKTCLSYSKYPTKAEYLLGKVEELNIENRTLEQFEAEKDYSAGVTGDKTGGRW